MNSSRENVLLCHKAFAQCFYLVRLICFGSGEIMFCLCLIEIIQLALTGMLNMGTSRIRLETGRNGFLGELFYFADFSSPVNVLLYNEARQYFSSFFI